MIRGHERISPAQAASGFREWASLFPPGFFVNLVAYTDESGTDGRSEVLIVGGLVGLREDWVGFCKKWQKVLNDHSAKYFHFREWSAASAVARKTRVPSSDFENNHYRTWGQSELDDFLLKLAEVAMSNGRFVVGGYVPQIQLRADQANGKTKTTASAEELCVDQFFDSVVATIERVRRVLRRQGISFFFDHSKDKKWKNIVRDAYDVSCQKYKQFKSLTIVNRGLKERVAAGDVEFLPLQAADMVAYRLRQKMEDAVTFDFSRAWPQFDGIIFKEIDDWASKRSLQEKDEMMRRVLVVPEDATYEQVMAAAAAKGKYKNENKIKQ